MCQALSLTGINVSPDELHSCHRLNKKDRVIVKFKCRKHRQNVLYNRKNLQSNGLELTQLKFSGKLFVNESLSHENQQLAYKCRKLKSARKIYSTCFYKNCVNIKLSERSNPVKLFYVRDIENLMGTDNLEEFLRKSSSSIVIYLLLLISCYCYCLKQQLRVYCGKRRSCRFRRFHGRAPVLESLFN